MLGGLGNLAGMIKNAGMLQARMTAMQNELAAKRFTAESGAGAVRVTVDGHGTLVDLKIDPASTADLELLEDLIKAALGAAVQKSRDAMRKEFTRLTGGLGLPGLDSFLGGS